MQKASSASATNLACLSASLKTATVGMPRRLAVVSTLQAISPLQDSSRVQRGECSWGSKRINRERWMVVDVWQSVWGS